MREEGGEEGEGEGGDGEEEKKGFRFKRNVLGHIPLAHLVLVEEGEEGEKEKEEKGKVGRLNDNHRFLLVKVSPLLFPSSLPSFPLSFSLQ